MSLALTFRVLALLLAFGISGAVQAQAPGSSLGLNGVLTPGNCVSGFGAQIAQDAGIACTLPAARTDLGAGPTLAAKDYGADGTGATDASAALTTACAAATAASVPLGLNGNYKVSTNLALVCDLAFSPGASLLPDTAKTVTITGKIDASEVAHIFAGAGSVVAATAPLVSVAWWGAMGATDATASFIAATGSNRVIKVPPATYTLNTFVNPPRGHGAHAAWLINNVSNFRVDSYGAKLAIPDASASPVKTWVEINNSSNFSFMGLEFVGNRTGLSAGQENAGLVLFNTVDFVVRDLTYSGNWGDLSAAIAGDWLLRGTIDNIGIPQAGQCLDLAFAKDVNVSKFHAVGADTTGAQGAGSVGAKCFSLIYDAVNFNKTLTGTTHGTTTVDGFSSTSGMMAGAPISGAGALGIPAGATIVSVDSSTSITISAAATLSATGDVTFSYNLTGDPYIDSDGVRVSGFDASNFIIGWTVQTKGTTQFVDNYWHDNPGRAATSAQGAGGWVVYNASGNASSVGRPPGYITVSGDRYSNNGGAFAGCGISIANSAIANTDVISNIKIDAAFDNNTDTGICSTAYAGLASIETISSVFSGAAQTTAVDGATLSATPVAVGTTSTMLPSNRNLLINPSFDLDQALEGATLGLSGPAADGWRLNLVSAATGVTVNRASASPPSDAANYELLTIGTGNATVNAADNIAVFQRLPGSALENSGFGTSAAKPFSMSFSSACTVPGTYSVSIRNAALNRGFIHQYTLASANVWQNFVFSGLGDTTGTWITSGNAIAMQLGFVFEAGSNFQFANADAWGAGNRLALAGQIQLSQTTGATCSVTNVKFEFGGPTPFRRRALSEELLLAQAYYRKTFPQGTKPAQSAGVAGAVCDYARIAASRPAIQLQFQPPMKATPTVTTYNPSANNANWRNTVAASDITVSVDPSTAISDSGVQIVGTGTMATIGDNACIHAVFDSRL